VDGGWAGMGSRGGVTIMDWREVLWRNSWVKRWLWGSTYERGFVWVTSLIFKSLKSLRRPQNTYKLKSLKQIDRLTTTNSLNNVFTFYIYIMIEASPWRRSWKDLWGCIMQELNRDATKHNARFGNQQQDVVHPLK
jgi:hypothetical protein